MPDPVLLEPREAINFLTAHGVPPPEAWHLITAGLREGRVRCQADSITTHFMGAPDYVQRTAKVPCDAWIHGRVPASGHRFWRTGDVNLTISLPGSLPQEEVESDVFSLALVAPTMEVRGALLNRHGIEFILAERETGEQRCKPERSKLRGRTPGAGAYTAMDAPLLDEMAELISSKAVASVHKASLAVARKAHGHGAIESKAARLAKAFRARQKLGV